MSKNKHITAHFKALQRTKRTYDPLVVQRIGEVAGMPDNCINCGFPFDDFDKLIVTEICSFCSNRSKCIPIGLWSPEDENRYNKRRAKWLPKPEQLNLW
jgi:hypothetical protein